jgi:hypothetical protein
MREMARVDKLSHEEMVVLISVVVVIFIDSFQINNNWRPVQHDYSLLIVNLLPSSMIGWVRCDFFNDYLTSVCNGKLGCFAH